MRERCLKVKIKKAGDRKMAEFDYEVVNGRKIRVRPVETVLEVDDILQNDSGWNSDKHCAGLLCADRL